MHRRAHIRGATRDISGGFQSKLDIIMQLTDERSLESLVIAEKCLSGGTRFTEKSDLTKGKVFVTRINSQHSIKRSGNVGRLQCEICLKPFVTPGWLRRLRRLKHGLPDA